MKFLLSDDDIWNVTADAIVVPADCSMGIDLSLLTRAGPTFCAHYEQMIQQQRMKFPLTEPTVQQLQPGNILRCKGLFLLFPGSKKGKKATELDGFNVTEAYKLLMNQITKLEYNSMAIMLSSTDSKSSVSEMLFCVSSIASKKVGFGEITLFSKSKPVMKTTCFLLGGKCLDLSTPEKTNVFIKSLTSSAIIKSSMKMVLKTAQGKSPCYFAIARTNLKKAAGYILQCSGEHIKMSEVKADVELFGADHVLDLLILRGSGGRAMLLEFIKFLALPDVTMCMPSPGKVYVLESGEQVELAKVVRTYSYHEIFRMFLRYSEKKAIDDGKATAADVHEFVKTNCLGFSTAYKIMEVVVPVRRKRLQCIDNFQADSIEAFEYLNEYANELATMGVINAVTKSDLLRRSRVSSNFISYDQRVHMERFSDTINHCLCYLLSDPKKKEFATACNLGINGHSHDNVCSDCLECTDVFDVILEILRKTHAEYVDKEFPERIRISRMIEQMKLSKHDVLEYRKHQIRAFSSDMDRKDIVENLQPKEALIVLDFSLKLIPTGSVEKQSEWFGKAGISYHMTYCVANLDGSLYHHSFGHSADDLKQDSIAVSAITKHALLQLKENGVEKVYIRSDNAGTYHNAAYLATLFHLEKLTGVQILAYVFSEAQAGKGDADREISHSKRKIRDGVDSKKNATNANEVIEVLTTGTLLKASSFHEIELTEKSVSKSSFPGISSYGSLQFEPTGIRARKFDKIGEGIFLEEKKIISNEYDFEVLSEGGHLSQSAGFWKKFDDDEDKEVEPDHDVDVDDDSIEPAKEGIFSCPDRLCISRFLTVNGLAKHKLRQVHRTRKNSESTIDAGVRMFASAIETDTAAARSVKSDTLVSIKASHGKLPGKGWAMKSQQRAPPMDDEMKEVITKYFHERRGEGRRALAREIYAKVREMKNGKTGEYLFPLKDCPKESQCQSLISSLLRLESAAASLKNKAHKRSKLMDGADESDESSDDNRPSCSTSKDSDQKARKRKVSGKKSSLLRKEKTPIFEDDEFADFMEELDDNIDKIFQI